MTKRRPEQVGRLLAALLIVAALVIAPLFAGSASATSCDAMTSTGHGMAACSDAPCHKATKAMQMTGPSTQMPTGDHPHNPGACCTSSVAIPLAAAPPRLVLTFAQHPVVYTAHLPPGAPGLTGAPDLPPPRIPV
ncbi:hypothetical protein AA23498_2429 [Acetobacter nitrogenifigens DSM 23921 = NBRC 105050]|uniref:DUF2946 domain-containing protein n=1 Tax=Acetobacter nitrogenifigens DSM 23921 = NBRC 105050 TaxID=1120919 RepID=A0A511X7P0_9PROT|nr:hypothetical protein [Acetobacter nitrogenifigens]GBQ95770.1 hypothetical protein AA23498_2429 [Acetobacter nitrogenifigens DSM 23921 = NBRC 105050]GEN58935.1 hypothetical protein ANI02nite_08190 [Acetobacter nitrogenifigens DSM 23921 = NBRC 105050]